MADEAHSDVLNSTAQGQLRSILERVERLLQEKAEIDAQIKEVYAEAKGNGFDPKILRKVVRIRKQDRAKRQEEEAMLDLYLSAVGELPLFAASNGSGGGSGGGIAKITLTSEDGRSVSGTPDDLAIAERMLRGASEDDAIYAQAVAIVLRDGRASTSYIQRRLQLGYNRAASLVEQMEREGVVGPPNHAGKREILQREAA